MTERELKYLSFEQWKMASDRVPASDLCFMFVCICPLPEVVCVRPVCWPGVDQVRCPCVCPGHGPPHPPWWAGVMDDAWKLQSCSVFLWVLSEHLLDSYGWWMGLEFVCICVDEFGCTWMTARWWLLCFRCYSSIIDYRVTDMWGKAI